jgi:hypothetical protein
MKLTILICLVLALTSAPVFAQQSAPADTISWRDTGPKAPHGLAEVYTAEGRFVRAYFPVTSIGFEEIIGYFRSNPEVRPFPKMQYIKVDKLRSATIRGNYFENMRASGHSDVLALRVIDGPATLFVFSGTAGDHVPMFTMVPGLMMVAVIGRLGGSAIERNRWFVRFPDQPLVAISRSGFSAQMSTLTANYPALSNPIAAAAEGYRYADVVHIIQLYNAFLASPPPAPAK